LSIEHDADKIRHPFFRGTLIGSYPFCYLDFDKYMMEKEVKKSQPARTDLDRYRDMTSLIQSGWWEYNVTKREYNCSESLCRIFGWKSSTISADEYIQCIREDYREQMKNDFYQFSSQRLGSQALVYPLASPQGEVWVKSQVGNYFENETGQYFFGTTQVVTPPAENKITPPESTNRIFSVINHLSSSMSEFLTGEKEEDVINHILQNLLDFYAANNACLFEFSEDHNRQRCSYEVSNHELVKIKDLSHHAYYKNEKYPWVSKQILSQKSVVLDTLSKFPMEAQTDYEFFSSIGFQSMIFVPLVDGKDVWGFISLNIIQPKHWSDDDYLCLLASSRLINIFISLLRIRRSKDVLNLQKETLMKHMPIGYARFTVMLDQKNIITDYRIEEANLVSAKLIGFPANSEGMLGSQLHDKDFMAHKRDFLQQVLNEKYKEEDVVLQSHIHCHKIAYVLHGNEIVELLVDTTETVNAFKAKYKSEKLFKDIFINIPIGEAIYDINGHMTDMNEAFMEIFGLNSFDNVRGYSFLEDSNITDEIKNGIIKDTRSSWRIDYSFDKVDNYTTFRRGTVSLNCKIIRLFDDEDKCIGFMIICVEDSDRLIAMSRVHDFENFFSLISDYAKVGYAKYNLLTFEGYAIKQWYKNAAEDENTPMSDIVGVYNHVHPDDRKRLLAFFEKVKRGNEKGFVGEIRVRRPGTTDKWNWVYSNLLLTKYAPDENDIEIIGVNYDITHFKEVEKELIGAREKAETMDRLKSAFLANMSHEIRTPLNAIVGFSDLLVSTEDQAERQQYLTILRENNDLLLQLINDILDLSKLEAGMVELSYAKVDINALCNDIAQAAALKASKGVEILFDSYMPVCNLLTDRNRLTQVLTNFTNNAIKFTSTGSIRIGYEFIDDDHIRFYVADTGIGIDEDKQTKVFERFVKLNDFAQGTGLGLSICTSIIEEMGGIIGVDSKLGKGSCFWFILPADQKEATSIQIPMVEEESFDVTKTAEKDRSEQAKSVILIAEDIESNYVLDKAILKSEYHLERAKNGLEAVQMAAELHPDLILMDLKMPEMDGLEATRKIRESDSKIPILAVTAFAFEQDLQNAMQAGCNGYISKPISAEKLRKKISEALKKN
jgi:signal transduction histidine kinase/PAS domain-containing protein/ActR/RegA family two-component response regulator